jgi:uncharacterized protein (TIGR02444 family)
MIIHYQQQKKHIPDHALWRFCYDIYQKPPVEQACLALQEHCKVNVNIVLSCIWWAQQGYGVLSQNQLASLNQLLSSWQQRITWGLRRCRQKIKKDSTPSWRSLRQHLLQTELLSEKIQLCLIYERLDYNRSQLRRSSQRSKDAVQNISHYFAVLGRQVNEN